MLLQYLDTTAGSTSFLKQRQGGKNSIDTADTWRIIRWQRLHIIARLPRPSFVAKPSVVLLVKLKMKCNSMRLRYGISPLGIGSQVFRFYIVGAVLL